MPDETKLRGDRWRVRKYVVQVPAKEAIARPWQLQAPVSAPPPMHTVSVWGVWPPQWSSEYSPMLMFPQWVQAFRAAWDRAQFAAIPPVKQPRFELPENLTYTTQIDDDGGMPYGQT